MISPIYTLTKAEINLLISLSNQLNIWFEPDVIAQLKLYLDSAITNGTITKDDIDKLLLLLKKTKTKISESLSQVQEPETASDSWDEILEMREKQNKANAQRIAINASSRAHLQSAVYNKNLPSRCMLALHRVIERNVSKHHGLRRQI